MTYELIENPKSKIWHIYVYGQRVCSQQGATEIECDPPTEAGLNICRGCLAKSDFIYGNRLRMKTLYEKMILNTFVGNSYLDKTCADKGSAN
jgi:hypothetical protein